MLVLRSRVNRVEAVAFSPDGALLAVGGTTGLELWSVHHHERIWRWEDDSGLRTVEALHISQEGWLLVKFLNRYPLKMFDLKSGASQDWEFPYSDNLPEYWAVDRDRDHVAVLSAGRQSCWRFERNPRANEFPFQRIVVWDWPIGEENTGSMVFHPGRTEGQPELWTLTLGAWQMRNANTGEMLHLRRGSNTRSRTLLLSPNRDFIIGYHQDCLIVWLMTHLKNPARFQKENRRQFTGVAFHPSGDFLATASNDRAIRLWDVEGWKTIRTFEWKAGRMRSIAFAPDGLIAAAGGESGEFVLFDFDL
jgi:WD40 repeat protein